jgi:EAL domain-containing protein (putative c-di-GMP-specific phosphodiesterase class I)
MKISATIVTTVFSALCAIAIIAGVWGFLTGNGAVSALVAAVVLLVAAQLILFFVFNADTVGKQQTPQALAAMNARLDKIENSIDHLSRSQLARPVPPSPVLEEPSPARPQRTWPEQAVPPEQDTVPTAALETVRQMLPDEEPAVPETFQGPRYLDDRHLSLYLEPIIDISTMATVFYRAELALQTEQAERIKVSLLETEISDAGDGAAMDMKLFTRLGPVIDRLAAKGKVNGVICPVSKHSFANEAFLRELTSYLQHYPELARVVVIEITQANLARLSDDGMAGLAFLAQAGATFCLGGAGLESPDLDSLSSLGFRYLDMDYTDNVNRYGWPAFSADGPAVQLHEIANRYDIKIIGSGLKRKSQYDALNNFIHYGRGPAFSPARLVRTDFAESAVRAKAA